MLQLYGLIIVLMNESKKKNLRSFCREASNVIKNYFNAKSTKLSLSINKI